MRRVVGSARIVVVHVLGLMLLVGGLLASFAGRVGSGRADRWRAFLFHLWCLAVARVIGMRVELEGRPPAGGFLLVANHQGYVDILALSSRLVTVFVARDDLARWPFVGRVTRSVGTLYVKRESKRDIPRVAARMRRVLAHGTGVVVFPEGTSTDGTRLLPFKPAFLETAVGLGIPVHHAAIRYRTPDGSPPARTAVAWSGGFYGHLFRLLCLPGFTATISFGAEPIRGVDRKELAEALHRAIRERI